MQPTTSAKMKSGIDAPEPLQEVIVQPKKAKFNTREIAQDQNNIELYVKLHLKEMIIYGLFLVIFFSSFFRLYEYNNYLINREISSVFLETRFLGTKTDLVTIKFMEILDEYHFWTYLSNVLPDKLCKNNELNPDENLVMENKLLYRPRVRQVRVKDGCHSHIHFKPLSKKCFYDYRQEKEDTKSFALENGIEINYSDESATQGFQIHTKIADYKAGGYYFDFPESKDEALSLIFNLSSNLWRSRFTRAVFVNFAVFNYNRNAICTVNLVFEFPSVGGVVQTYTFNTSHLYNFVLTNSILTMIGMILIILFLVYYTIEEIFEFYYFRMRYFLIFWNWIDLCIVFSGWYCVLLTGYMAYEFPEKLDQKRGKNYGPAYYNDLVVRHNQILQTLGYLFFLTIIKIIKYIDVNRSLTIVYLSIGRCLKTIMGYILIMNIILATFISLGFCVYGSEMESFSTIKWSVRSSIGILMRSFNFLTFEQTNQTFTTIFFTIYTCSTIFVLFGLVMAIIFHSYFDVDIEIFLDGRELYVCSMISMYKLFYCFGLKKTDARRHQNRRQSELDHYIPYQDIYKTLRRCNIVDLEIKTILDKYGFKPQKKVHEDEARRMFQNVLVENSDIKKKIEGSTSSDDSLAVKKLINRIEKLETSVIDIDRKCDVVINRLKSIRITVPPTSNE